MSEFQSRGSPGVLGFEKLADGGVFETTSRFQIASPGLYQPARRPMRGSGLGGEVDMSMAGDAADPAVECDEAHPANNKAAKVSDKETTEADFMEIPLWSGRGEHGAHSIDLSGLIGVDIRREAKNQGILGRARAG